MFDKSIHAKIITCIVDFGIAQNLTTVFFLIIIVTLFLAFLFYQNSLGCGSATHAYISSFL